MQAVISGITHAATMELDALKIREKTLLPFYTHVGERLGYMDSEVENYDCRKIWVAKNILDVIIEAYQKTVPTEYVRNPELVDQEIMMTLAMAGPKTDFTLTDNFVRVEPGFVTLKKAKAINAEDKKS